MRFPKLHTSDEAQELYTPDEASIKIIPFINKSWVVWEMCYGRGDMANALTAKGLQVVGNTEMNCFTEEPDSFDCIITNPPWRNNKEFVEKAISYNKPFAFLLRLEHLGGVKAFDLFSDLEGFGILIPEKRVNFITPRMRAGGEKGSSSFHSIWMTRFLNLPQQIVYIR